MSSADKIWIEAAHTVLNLAAKALHVSEVENQIRSRDLVSGEPSLSLEVLLTKEAAMGRRFTKVDGSMPGYFSLLPSPEPQATVALSPNLTIGNSLTLQSEAPDAQLSINDRYLTKYKQLKSTCKNMLYLNAALYDEISRIQKKIDKVTSDRRTLLLKLMVDQNIPNPKAKSENRGDEVKAKDLASKKDSNSNEPPSKKAKPNLKPDGKIADSASESDQKGKQTKAPDVPTTKSTKKQKPSAKKAIMIPAIELDSNGRPILPLELAAGLTIYSFGEINDKPGYCRSECFYPVGYCCTREFASTRDVKQKCLYTCKVTETLSGPKFEISSDNEPTRIFTDLTPEGCHSKLLKFMQKSLDIDLQLTNDSDFFGLKHPVVKNLLQCSQGAQNCLEYSWCKFEVVRSNAKVSPVQSELDPATCFSALAELLSNQDTDVSRISDEEPGEST